MLKKLLISFSSTWAIAVTEIGINVRLIRTWFFVFIVAGVSAVSYSLEQFLHYQEMSAISSSAYETWSPLLLPMKAFSEFQFLISFGIVFTAFDFLSRDKRARFDEVISTLPLTNLQLVFGRALGISVLFYVVIAAFLCSYYVLGAICEFALPSTGFRRPELVSTIATLVLDVFPYVLLWTTTVILVTVLVRYRVIATTISIALMLLVFWLQNNVPGFSQVFWGVSVLNSQLPSEIAPILPSSLLVVQRLLLVLLACATLYLVANLYPRLDRQRSAGYLARVFAMVAIWFGGFGSVLALHGSLNDERRAFYTAHNTHTAAPVLDLIEMNGTIDIHPAKSIEVDIDLKMRVIEAGDPLVFSFNPGYEIEHVSLNDEPIAFTFENGLLLVQRSTSLRQETTPVLNVRAKGDLNTDFTYLESRSEPRLSLDEIETRLVAYGTHASINHRNFVALMPAVAWYPMPGNHLYRDPTQGRPRDFYKVDLSVSVPNGWLVGGPGKANPESQRGANEFRFTPKSPLHQVALFASEFERRSINVNGIEFELLVSPSSTRNLDLFEPIAHELNEEITEFLQRAIELGFRYPFDAFSVIEVPNYLDTFRQSTHKPSTRTQPGIFLLREGKFLDAHFHAPIHEIANDSNLTDEEKHKNQFAYLQSYFNNDISGGHALAAAVKNLFAFQTYPTGDGAESLSFVLDYLILKLFDIKGGFHSAYVLDDADLTSSTEVSVGNVSTDSRAHTIGDMFFFAYANRPDVWHALFEGYQDTVWDEATHHHAQILLGAQVGDLLLALYGRDRVAQLLATIRERFQSKSFTYADLLAVGKELEIPLEEATVGWFNGVKPAGFRTSKAKTVRLPDASDGTPIYESSLFVENGETNLGFFTLEYATEQHRTFSGYEFISTDLVKLPGASSVELAIQSSLPIEAIQIVPYLSLNRNAFAVTIERLNQIPQVSRSTKPFITSSSWSLDEGDSIVIDDLDSGFSVDESTKDEPFLNFGVLSITPIAYTSNGMDAGLQSAGGFTHLSDREWLRQQADTAFGRYRKTFVRAESFASAPMAHFRAEIPSAGSWRLEYHLPEILDPSGLYIAGWGRYGILLAEGNNWADFDLRLRVGDVEKPIEFEGKLMRAGWNDLGTFELPNASVIVSISSDSGRGTTVIDAIRWTPEAAQTH